MIIYIVWFINCHGEYELVDIFSKEESAKSFISRHDDKWQMEVEPYKMETE